MARTREIRPWYRWQWHRFANSRKVLRMGLAARGAYRGLLDKTWELGGKLPNDPEIMWRYAGALSAEEFAAVADQVLAMFTISEDGKWLTNETLTEEWDATDGYLADLSEKRSAAGKKGNEKRWDRKEVANDSKASLSSSSNTVAIQDKAKTPYSPPFDSEAAVDRIWKQYPRMVNEPRSKRSIALALAELSAPMGGDAEAVAFLETMTQKYRLLVTPFKNIPELWDQVPNPWNWFEGKRFNEEQDNWIPRGARDGQQQSSKQADGNKRTRANYEKVLRELHPDAYPDGGSAPGADVAGNGNRPDQSHPRDVGKIIDAAPVPPLSRGRAAGGS